MNRRKPGGLDLAGVLGRETSDKRFDILRRIGEGGSISEAARRAGVSYKAAWQAIETLGNLAGTPMVEKAVGGSGGGGALLTPAGRRVLAAAALLDRARAQVLATLAPGSTRAAAGPGLAALALRTSMRNQFPCEVRHLARGGGGVRVALALGPALGQSRPSGSSGLGGRDGPEAPAGAGIPLLFARITRESAQLLELARGRPVLALCKATAVRVAAQRDAAEGHNLLAGEVLRASRAALGGEVALRLANGISLVGFAPAGHGLKAGQPAWASVEESSVVIAVAG